MKDSGLSLLQLAKRSGLGFQSIHGFARGYRGLSLTSAARLCSALGLELRPVRAGRRSKTKGG